MKSIYTCTAIKNLIQEYTRLPDYEIVQMTEGGCGYGDLILAAPGYKYVIIHEIFLNEWSSGHTIRMYNRLPEKYRYYFEYDSPNQEYQILAAGKEAWNKAYAAFQKKHEKLTESLPTFSWL